MSIISEYMIYINIILLLGGATSVHLGASFLKRERNSKGFFKYSIFLLALGNGLCSMGYAIMSMSPDPTVAGYFRVIGLIGINIYIIAEVILITSVIGTTTIAEFFLIFITSLGALLDVLIFGNPSTMHFHRLDNYTIYVQYDSYRFIFHMSFLIMVAICILYIGIIWTTRVKYRRDRKFVLFAFLSNFIFAITAFPDFGMNMRDWPYMHAFYCVGVYLAFVVFYVAAKDYMVFYITVNSISRDIFTTLGAGLLVFDTNQHLNLSNEYANKLLGLDKEPNRIRLKEIFNLESGEPKKMFEQSKKGIAIDYKLTANVTGKVTQVNFSCKMDKHREPLCYILIATDLTEENRLIQEAQAANAAKSNFLSNISHEIRTPINVISGMNELILRECKEQNILKYSENINVASRSLTSLINDVLDFSKIESGKLELVSDDFNIGMVLNDSYNMFLNMTQTKQQNFSLYCAEDTPSILIGDEVRLKQILSNLISNAVKYTPEYGTITIAASYISRNQDQVDLSISVRDTGIGIKEEDIPNLFETFQRFEISKNRSIQGSGLGLAIVKNLANLMNGRIDVESVYGKGSTFTVTIPFKVADSSPVGEIKERFAAGTTEKYKASFWAKKARILTVDDVQMNIDVFVGLLKNTGVKIDSAISGPDALDLMKENKYDIIFLDHMMPEMDGVEVLHRLKADANNLNINTPVIMLTANATMGADRKYLEDGFDDYLSKPIHPLSLENMVIKYLPNELIEASQNIQVNTNDIIASSSKATVGADNSNASTSDFLDKLSFLDTQSGLEFAAGDQDFYRQILERYVSDDKSESLERFYQEKDWPNYQIVSHSIKGTSLTIGAAALSEAAKGLEFAVKENRLPYIDEHHQEVLEMYNDMVSKLKSVL